MSPIFFWVMASPTYQPSAARDFGDFAVWRVRECVPVEMNDAALPSGLRVHLVDRFDGAAAGIGNDELEAAATRRRSTAA
jgi:hypothetical protein